MTPLPAIPLDMPETAGPAAAPPPGERRASRVAVSIQGVGKSFTVQRSWRELLLRPRDRTTQTVLHDIHLEVAQGEFFGLLGQNGAGKSTLFRILAGLVLPDHGQVVVGGVELGKAAGRRGGADLAPVIPSERSLYWRLGARENLRLYASLHGMERGRVDSRIEEVLEVVGLAGTGQKQVGLFSSGMRQRLLIARALLPEPRILLLDEPTRSLDPVSARDFRRFLREEIGGRQGCTVLLATHDHEEVRDLCDRIGVLHQGRMLAVGSTEEVLQTLEFQRIRVRTREPVPTWLEGVLVHHGATLLEVTEPDDEGWRWIRIRLPDAREPEELLPALMDRGLGFSRFEREELSLADLLEGVARRGDRGNGGTG
jgi:ABC-2 type transport system ATP-binding protein